MVATYSPRSLLRRALNLAGILVAIAVLALLWGSVVRTLLNASPVESPRTRPNAIVWGDRVFTSGAELRRWLQSRRVSYRVWERQHPAAQAIFDGRAAPVTAAVARIASPTDQRRRASLFTGLWLLTCVAIGAAILVSEQRGREPPVLQRRNGPDNPRATARR